jgi:ABC-2 type transport system permease protein
MPDIIQWITHLIPARYFVAILQTVFMAGDIWKILVFNSLALLAMMLFFLGVVRSKAHKRLD